MLQGGNCGAEQWSKLTLSDVKFVPSIEADLLIRRSADGIL